MKTVSMKTKAWITNHSDLSPKDLLAGKNPDGLNFYTGDMTNAGWTFVGEVEFTVVVPDEKTLITNKIKGLRGEVKAIRAEATARVTHLEGHINDLLALTFDSSVTEAE